MNNQEFKKGDVVVCIDAEENVYITKGNEYIVIEAETPKIISTTTNVAGLTCAYPTRLFKLKEEKPVFKAMKFRVENEEHSKLIQEHLFSLGYKWFPKCSTVKHTEKKYLATYTNGRIAQTNSLDSFLSEDSIEYKLVPKTTHSLEEVIVEKPSPEQIASEERRKTIREMEEKLNELKALEGM